MGSRGHEKQGTGKGKGDIREIRAEGTEYPLCTRTQHCSFCPLCVAFVFAAYAIAPLAAASAAAAVFAPAAVALASVVVVVVIWLVLAAIFSYCQLNGSTTLAAHG